MAFQRPHPNRADIAHSFCSRALRGCLPCGDRLFDLTGNVKIDRYAMETQGFLEKMWGQFGVDAVSAASRILILHILQCKSLAMLSSCFVSLPLAQVLYSSLFLPLHTLAWIFAVHFNAPSGVMVSTSPMRGRVACLSK